jgi:hypothetical protein
MPKGRGVMKLSKSKSKNTHYFLSLCALRVSARADRC